MFITDLGDLFFGLFVTPEVVLPSSLVCIFSGDQSLTADKSL